MSQDLKSLSPLGADIIAEELEELLEEEFEYDDD